jgi:protein-tyrosine kinase
MIRPEASKEPKLDASLPPIESKWEVSTISPAARAVPFTVITEEAGPKLASPSESTSLDAVTVEMLMSNCDRKPWTPDPTNVLFLQHSEPSRGEEEMRVLRSRLYRVRESRPLKSILIASALPGEGRSFVAANLAQVLALQPDCRVLLIDGDLRNPGLHSTLGTCATPGLSDYLQREVEELRIIQRGESDALFFVPSGSKVKQPTEVIATGRLKALIERVETVFDWIIVDSPAAIPVSDACLLANFCDGVVMVVRSHATPFDIVREARRRFREESLVGVVLNGTDAKFVSRAYADPGAR